MIVRFFHRIAAVVAAAVASVLITAAGPYLWGNLLMLNLKFAPALPVAAAVMAPMLWLMWRWLGGKGWPARLSQARADLLRRRPVSPAAFLWSLIAGVLAVGAATGLWIVSFQLVPMHGNALPPVAHYSLLMLVPMLLMSSLVAPFMEEAAFRGYAQNILLRAFRPATAIALSSAMFAAIHLTQGFYLPKLFVYFAAGASFGTIAYLTKSIWPGIAVHFIADMTFFSFVWPYDAARRLVGESGADQWFWIHAGQFVVCTALAVLALRQLARVTGHLSASPRRGVDALAARA